MTFEEAALFSEVLHYIFTIGVTLAIVVPSYKDFFKAIIKIYLIFIVWGLTCFIFQGCPITLLENYVSEKIYGKPFYPDYTFTGSDFYYLATTEIFYVPLILGLIALFITKRYKDADI